MTRADLLDMALDELLWFASRSTERRREEARALERAHKREK